MSDYTFFFGNVVTRHQSVTNQSYARLVTGR